MIEKAADNGDPDMLTTWYREVYPAGPNDGFYKKLGDHTVSFVDRGPHQLVITFDSVTDAKNKAINKEPWLAHLCREQGYSHLGITTQQQSWYRNAPLIKVLEDLRNDDFFKQFERVVFAGVSMGGFAALAFCGLAKGATVIAFSPQVSLSKALIPWEDRFPEGAALDWTLPYGDASEHLADAAHVFVVYDPLNAKDTRHADLLSGANVTPMRAFGLGHNPSVLLDRMNRLDLIMTHAIQGDLTRQIFYENTRGRKDLYIYRRNVEAVLIERDKPRLLKLFRTRFRDRRRALMEKTSTVAVAPDPASNDERPPHVWPSAPGNAWMIDVSGDAIRYLSDRYHGQIIGYEERAQVTLAQTPPLAIGVIAFGGGVSIERKLSERFEWHVVDQKLSADVPVFAAESHGVIAQIYNRIKGKALTTTIALSHPQPGITEQDAKVGGDAYTQILDRIKAATTALAQWDKQLFIDRIHLCLLSGAPQVPEQAADFHYAAIAQELRGDVTLITGQKSFPLIVVSQSAGTQTDGTSQVILAEGRLDIDHPTIGIVVATPKYPFAMMPDTPATLTSEDQLLVDEIEAHALAEVHAGRPWYCPSLQIASLAKRTITAEFSTLSDLQFVSDTDHGFALMGCDNNAKITSVKASGKTVSIVCNKEPKGENLVLTYAWGATSTKMDGKPANTGGLRDNWCAESQLSNGRSLYRFALSGRTRIINHDG
ncbi:hypothetical protein [Parasulfitobacter algicola]|uniref:Uncharacterized protein n=1 Tax=Parasulfitobacter algicola TaxID=2614809 RepID=A0ABX2IYK7_9RHOB|nr:hypothetical protein [Sulfitobacter algicola]NSX55704.1 hypothetical protein [Sulfitobacter algicola]